MKEYTVSFCSLVLNLKDPVVLEANSQEEAEKSAIELVRMYGELTNSVLSVREVPE